MLVLAERCEVSPGDHHVTLATANCAQLLPTVANCGQLRLSDKLYLGEVKTAAQAGASSRPDLSSVTYKIFCGVSPRTKQLRITDVKMII